jgi:hypothetical protein
MVSLGVGMKNAIVIGRSNLVGRPLATLLLNENAIGEYRGPRLRATCCGSAPAL